MTDAPVDRRGAVDDPRRRIADLEQLLDVASRLGATVELDPLLEAIATAATAVLDCERATVFLHDPPTEELYSRLATGIAGSPLDEIRFPVSRGIAGEVARTGRVITLPDAYADPRFNPAFDRQTGFRTRNILACPLAGYDRTIVGVLQVLNKRGGTFGGRDEEMVRFLGTQAGVAIQRQMLLEQFAEKQRIQRDLSIARDIQQGLLPRERPAVAGFDIAGWNQPADETGGDSFDFLTLDDGTLAIALADATGHGIGAAMVMAETRALFRATVTQNHDLQGVMPQVNQLLCMDLPEGKFNTAFFGLLAPARHTLTFLSAGQGPILVYSAAADTVSELDTHGLPLGMMPDAEYEPTTVLDMAAGDVLVLLTDGFYEWSRSDGEQFGTARMATLLRAHHRLPATEFIRVAYEAVVEFSAGTRQADDLTAVVVRRLATA